MEAACNGSGASALIESLSFEHTSFQHVSFSKTSMSVDFIAFTEFTKL